MLQVTISLLSTVRLSLLSSYAELDLFLEKP